MGGAHNVALANLSQRLQTRPTVQMEQVGFLGTLRASLASRQPVGEQEYAQNLRTTGAFLAFIATGAACIAFYVNFRTYHLALEKLDSLTALFHNPNARVASGDQGKRILKKLGVSNEDDQPEERQTRLNDTLQQVAALLQASKGGSAPLQAASSYAPPAFVQQAPASHAVSSYQLPGAPHLAQPLLSAPHHAYALPGSFQVSAPVFPVPQMVTSAPQYHYPPIEQIKVAISNPEPIAEPAPVPRQQATARPSLDTVSKADLISLLLTQLAREGDLERQIR